MANRNNTRVKVPNRDPTTGRDPKGFHDDLSPNPQGRNKPDGGTCIGRSLVNCRRTTTISTLNVRTLKEARCREELATNLSLYEIDVLGIQEHRIVHEEEVKHEVINGQQLITTSATRNQAGAAVGGVGIMLGSTASSSLAKVTKNTERILTASFQGNPVASIIVTYCPTNTADEDTVKAHYEDLARAIEAIPAHNLLLVIGDFNARIGDQDAKFTFHKETNRNGRLLLDLANEKDLVVSSTDFCKKAGKLWTFISPGGMKYQLDYVLIRRKWRNSMLNVEAYSSFASVGSDHRIVSARVRLSLRKKKAEPRKRPYDWNLFKTRSDLQEQYTIEVHNRFQPLKDLDESATERYERFIKATEEAAEKVVPLRKRGRRARHSEDPRVAKVRHELNEVYGRYKENTSEANRQEYRQTKKKLKEAYITVEEEDLSNKIREVEKAHLNCKHGQSWKLINDITDRKATRKGQLEGNTQEERIENWYNHFKTLLGSPPNITDEDEEIPTVFEELDIKVGPFEQGEYEKAKKSLVEGKASGEDGIPPEVLKRCGGLDRIILDFCNRVLTRGEKPEQWSLLNIVPIPKSGDLRLGSNYRGISLSSLVAKIFNKMLLNRIRPAVDGLLRCNQNGFREGRSTVGHVLALRRLIEGIKSHNLPAIITFIDFKKAFDTIHRGKMLRILNAYGIPEQIVHAIGSLYEGTMAKVVTPDGDTRPFEIQAGVLQGDTLAPYLFVLVLDYALRVAIEGREEELGFQLVKRRSRRIGPKVVTDLDFADDIALLSEEVHQAQQLLRNVETSVARVGLQMNAGKTKFMAYNQQSPVCLKTTDGSTLEKVEDFKYLGSHMESTAKDINSRKAAAWRACNKMDKIWKSDLSSKLKTRLFLSTVESVLLYGCEAWTVTPKLEKQLDGCYTRMLRRVHNVHWEQHLTNKELYAGLPKLSTKIRARRLRFAGHTLRNCREIASNLVLWSPGHGGRRPGRPPLTYPDVLRRDVGLRAEDMGKVMEDRDYWAAIVVRVAEEEWHPT
ncbi:uncharacterized protein LOC144905694 [Branchiostoma floridae x Branchiostoma belcheri]